MRRLAAGAVAPSAVPLPVLVFFLGTDPPVLFTLRSVVSPSFRAARDGAAPLRGVVAVLRLTCRPDGWPITPKLRKFEGVVLPRLVGPEPERRSSTGSLRGAAAAPAFLIDFCDAVPVEYAGELGSLRVDGAAGPRDVPFDDATAEGRRRGFGFRCTAASWVHLVRLSAAKNSLKESAPASAARNQSSTFSSMQRMSSVLSSCRLEQYSVATTTSMTLRKAFCLVPSESRAVPVQVRAFATSTYFSHSPLGLGLVDRMSAVLLARVETGETATKQVDRRRRSRSSKGGGESSF